MPSSPKTPRRRTHSSSKSIESPSTRRNGRTPSFGRGTHQSPTNTSISQHPPSTYDSVGNSPVARRFSHTRDPSGDFGGSDGLGNLADELADALDEEGDASQMNAIVENGATTSTPQLDNNRTLDKPTSPSMSHVAQSHITGTPNVQSHSHHGRQPSLGDGHCSADEDGHGVVEGTLSHLDLQITGIDRLVRYIEREEQSDADPVLEKMVHSLRSLPAQSDIENGTSRLITTHTALSSHLTNQARAFQHLVHPLISPFAIIPEAEIIEQLLPLLSTLLVSLPAQNGQCLSALHHLRSLTADLQATLTYLLDSIYMNRQTMSSASRKLRTVTDLVIEMRQEAEARDEAIRWIEKGDWEKKLLGRESKNVCRDVVGGFEELCQDWRQRLVAGGAA